MDKLIKVLQYVWLGIAITGIITAVYFLTKGDWKDAVFFFIITFAGGVMYGINKRRYKQYFERMK